MYNKPSASKVSASSLSRRLRFLWDSLTSWKSKYKLQTWAQCHNYNFHPENNSQMKRQTKILTVCYWKSENNCLFIGCDIYIMSIYHKLGPQLILVQLWNHSLICSWNQQVLSYEGNVSCSRKQQEPLMRFKLTAGWLQVRHANHCTKTICERIKLTGGFTWSTYYVVALIIYLISVILELYNSHKFSNLLLGSRQGSSPPFELSFINSKLAIKLPWLD